MARRISKPVTTKPGLSPSQMFVGADGELSYSRVTCTIVVIAALVWGSYIVFSKQQIPDLMGVSALVTALYGFNRVSEAIESKK